MNEAGAPTHRAPPGEGASDAASAPRPDLLVDAKYFRETLSRASLNSESRWEEWVSAFHFSVFSTIFTILNEHSAEGRTDFLCCETDFNFLQNILIYFIFLPRFFLSAQLTNALTFIGIFGTIAYLFLGCMSSSAAYKIFIHFQKYLHPAVKRGQIRTEYRKWLF